MDLIPLIGAVLTFCLGVLGLVAPGKVATLVGIAPEGKLGVSEIRATYGGFFVGLGVGCLWVQKPEVYFVVGLAWLLAAASRIISFALDRSFSSKNIGGVVIEAGIGLLLVATVL